MTHFNTVHFMTLVLGTALTVTAFSYVSSLSATPERLAPIGTAVTGTVRSY